MMVTTEEFVNQAMAIDAQIEAIRAMLQSASRIYSIGRSHRQRAPHIDRGNRSRYEMRRSMKRDIRLKTGNSLRGLSFGGNTTNLGMSGNMRKKYVTVSVGDLKTMVMDTSLVCNSSPKCKQP